MTTRREKSFEESGEGNKTLVTGKQKKRLRGGRRQAGKEKGERISMKQIVHKMLELNPLLCTLL